MNNRLQLLEQSRDVLEAACNKASAKLARFPKSGSGLVSDAVRATESYKTAKSEYATAFERLRKFNQQYAREIHKLKKADSKRK